MATAMNDHIDTERAALLPVQHMAWIGDAVHQLLVRQHLVREGKLSPGQQVHRAAADLTSAAGQAALVKELLPRLTNREQELFQRGRNSKTAGRGNADYSQATGLEVVIGWLWLSSQHSRLEELFQLILHLNKQEG